MITAPKLLCFFKKLIPYLIIISVAILGHWQVFFLTNTLKWDVLDCFLPSRYFVSECVQNNIFPFWNPYQMFGFPVHADLVSTWSPEVWIVSYLFGYTNYTLQYIFILYTITAGIGMYRLICFLGNQAKISLVIGIAYMLCGFMIGNAQNMAAICGAALIPWALKGFIQMSNTPNLIHALLATVPMFLMISCGYPSLSIILCYMLFAIFVFYVLSRLRAKDYKNIYKLFLYSGLWSFLLILLSIGLFIALYQIREFSGRYYEVNLQWAQQHPFSPQSMISWLLPFVAVKNIAFFNTDLSMTNMYMGLFTLIFLAFYFRFIFLKQINLVFLFACMGIFFLLVSFGNYLPFHALTYHVFPLAKLFRYPAFYRLFAAVSFFIVTANALSHLDKNHTQAFDFVKKSIMFLSIPLLLVFVYASFHTDYLHSVFLNSKWSFYQRLEKSTIYEHIIIQAVIQVVLLLLLIWTIRKHNFKYAYLILFTALDMFLSVQLNTYYTVVSKRKPSEVYAELSVLPKGFPIPPSDPIKNYPDRAIGKAPLWHNTNTLTKTISWDAFGGFFLNGYKKLEDDSILFNNVIENPPLYLTDQICSVDELALKKKTGIHRKDVFLDKKEIPEVKIQASVGDSCYISSFSPNQITIQASTKFPQLLTLLQSNYTGWKAFIDDNEIKILTSNFLFMSVLIPSGTHEVKFIYDNTMIIYALFFSYSLFLIILLIIMGYYFHVSNNTRNRTA
jgi:hypothetical protein